MMKVPIIFCCLLALGTCAMKPWRRNNVEESFVDLVKGYGYPVNSYDVQTEDGYILNLFRIPHGRENPSQRSGDQTSSSGSGGDRGEKRAVFLMHGVMTDGECFVYGGPSESIALKLADAGYDVFVGNARGTVYGQKHTTLDPQRDAAFWRYCWQDIGRKDLPALIDKAISVSGKSSLSYIGHNEGTTAFYVFASENDSYNSKIDRQLSLGPIAYMKNADSEILKQIEDHFSSKSWIMKNVGINSVSPANELIKTAQSNCEASGQEESICKNMYFLFNGYNSKKMNQTTIRQVVSRVPSTASVRQFVHFAQLKKNGRFEKYSEGGAGEEFNLSKVNVPVCLFYTPDDPLSDVEDVKKLASTLPNIYEKYNFEELTNNVDLLWSENMENVYNKIKQALEVNTERTAED